MFRNVARILLINLKEKVFEYGVHFKFSAINNVSEYEALSARLRLEETLKRISIESSQ
jgi:hypothetical protein